MNLESNYIHIPILKNEIIDYFNKTKKEFFLDGTAGEGGHSMEISSRFDLKKIIILDRDPEMLERAKKRNQDKAEKLIPLNQNFSDFKKENLSELEIPGLDGILLDFGISMYHIKSSGRGFTFRGEEALDMRLSPDLTTTASDVLNHYKQKDLERIFLEYGEENWSKKIAENIFLERKKRKFQINSELVELIEKTIPRKFWPPGAHPSYRIFQALRIEVNGELKHIENGLKNLIPLLREGGIICCISFHSLEDRIVKNEFRGLQSKNIIEIISKKPIVPSENEIRENPASRSAKLRVAMRTRSEIN